MTTTQRQRNCLETADSSWKKKTIEDFNVDTWRTWSKQRLEKEYSPSQWSMRPNTLDEHINIASGLTRTHKDSIEGRFNVPYGERENQKIDFYHPADLPNGAPVAIFLHGGYWQECSRSMAGFAARALVDRGMALAVPGYTLAPAGSLEDTIEEAREAVRFIAQYARDRKSSGVHVVGHSAGAHLAALTLSLPDCQDIIKGALLVSGVFDLRPLVGTYVNDPLHLTEESAWHCSPLREEEVRSLKRNNPSVHVAVSYGDSEAPEFIRQSKCYLKALQGVGMKQEEIVLPGLDHFQAIEELSRPDSPLTKVLLNQAGL